MQKKGSFSSFKKYFCFYAFIRVKSLLFFTILLSFCAYLMDLGQVIDRYSQQKPWKGEIDEQISDYCENELMRYKLRIRTHGNLTDNFVSGRRFDCSHVPMLHKFHLSDRNAIFRQISLKRPGEHGFHFVTAANIKYYPFLKTLLFNIKTRFECRQRIIVYDLDGFSANKTMMDPLNAVCGLELRVFDWSLLPSDVRERVNIYAWKFIIFSQSYFEFDTWIWVDTSIKFIESTLFEPIFVAIEKGEVSELILPGENIHGMRYATNPRMYTFLPFAVDWLPSLADWEKVQWESNIFIVHKSEYTRKLLKWSLLCALTRACIEPTGSINSYCDVKRHGEIDVCHRMDQSILTILTVNSEYDKLFNQDVQFVTHSDAKHPRKSLVNVKYEIRRRENLTETEEQQFVKTVNCCNKQIL